MSDTKFAQLLASKKIDPRRVLLASRSVERLTREDRTIKLAKRRARTSEGDKAEKETRKPHSGRPVTPRALDAAIKGGTLSGPAKTRLLRAVNKVLEQKKQEPVDIKALF
jgi:tRNA pseudouridine-54 N-methylase